MKLIAKTLFGLEEVLASEPCRSGGPDSVTVLNRAVAFEGSKSLLYRGKLQQPAWQCQYWFR